jgi:ribonuclease P protein component
VSFALLTTAQLHLNITFERGELRQATVNPSRKADIIHRVIKGDQRASKQFRITRRNDIDRVFSHARRVSDATLTLLVITNGLAISRLGLGVSMRHGNAARRNRVKRLCREAFRLIRSQLPSGCDYMILPRAGAVLTLATIQKSILMLAPKAASAAKAQAAEKVDGGDGGQKQ